MTRNIFTLAFMFLLGGANAWSQSTVNFAIPTDAGPAGYAILNPGAAPATVTFTAYANTPDGVQLGSTVQTVAAGGQLSKLSTDLFPGKTNSKGGLRGWVQVTSAASGLLGIEAAGDFSTGAEAIGSATPSSDQILPVSGTTKIFVGNPGTTALSATIKAYDENGSQLGTTVTKNLQAKGLYDSEDNDGIFFGTDQVPRFAAAKHLRISATGPVVATAVLLTTILPNGRDPAAVNGTDVAGATAELNFPHVVSGPAGGATYASLVSITNPTTSAQRLTLTFSPDSAAPVSMQASLQPNGSLQKTIQDLFGLSNNFQGGWLKVQGASQLIGYVSFGETTGGGIDMVPVQPAGQTSMLFAHIADLPPWQTGLALLNTSVVDATVEVFAVSPDGSLIGSAQNLPTARFTLPAKTKTARLLENLIPTTQSRSSDGGFVFVRSTNNVPLFGIELFFLRSGAAMANVAAESLPQGITYTPPYPSSPGVDAPPPYRQWPGPVNACLEARIGRQAVQDLQLNRRQPTAEEAQALTDCNAPSTSFDKLDLASMLPLDKQVSAKVGSVVITYYNPVTMSLVENGVHMTFTARNTGAAKVTLRAVRTLAMEQAQPPWIYHWFPIFELPLDVSGGSTVRRADVALEPGASATFEWFTSNDARTALFTMKDGYLVPAKKQATLPYRFDIVETGESATINVDVVSYGEVAIDFLQSMTVSVSQPAAIVGRLTTQAGLPIPNADIHVWLLEKHKFINLKTDGDGRYATQVPSIEDIKRLMNPNLEPYGAIGYFVWTAVQGFTLGYRGGISPAPGQTVTVDMTLDPARSPVSYHMTGETRTSGPFGYWWTMFTSGLDAVEAVQADHPPQPVTPGHVIKTDINGREIWRVATAQECWGFDVAANGEWTAAACDDNLVYIMDRQGNVVQRLSAPAFQVRFGPDSKSILAAAPDGKVSLLDVTTGRALWSYSAITERVRNVRWNRDGTRITVGFANGQVAQFTADGKKLWQTGMGEYPLYLAVDSQQNVYAAGKSRLLFSWDANGRLRWRVRTIHTLNNGLGGVSSDGSYGVAHTFNGELTAFDGGGHILWQRGSGSAGIDGIGHQGLKMTPDGEWTVVGMFDGTVALLDRTGTVRWSYRSPDPPVTRPPTSFCYSGTCIGAQSVDISDDGKYIAVGFENNVIRVFQRDP